MAVVDLFKDIPPALLDLRGFWEHSIAVGSSARVIASARGERDTERNFVAGMLHDLGVVMSAQIQPEKLSRQLQAARQANCLIAQAERVDQGFDHADLAAVVLERWRLPQVMIEVVAGHHRPLLTAKHARECADVHFSDLLVEALGFGISGEVVVPPLDAHAWELCGLPIANLAQVALSLERSVVELTDIFIGSRA